MENSRLSPQCHHATIIQVCAMVPWIHTRSAELIHFQGGSMAFNLRIID